jgi:hypothetical protein
MQGPDARERIALIGHAHCCWCCDVILVLVLVLILILVLIVNVVILVGGFFPVRAPPHFCCVNINNDRGKF